MVKISNAPLALDKIGQCLKFKQSGQILKHWKLQNRPWRRPFLLDQIRSMKVISFCLSCFPPSSCLYKMGKLFINSYLGKPCGGGNNNKIVFFFFSYFLHTWLYLLMTPALIMLVIPGLPSYNEVEVYYSKGVIGLPIVNSFHDRWYYIFFLEMGSLKTSSSSAGPIQISEFPEPRSRSMDQGTCRVSTYRRSTVQDLVVVGLIVEKIWNLRVNCVKVTGAWNIGQGHQVNVPDKSGGQGDVLYKVWWLL